jgi:hypothetical protein
LIMLSVTLHKYTAIGQVLGVFDLKQTTCTNNNDTKL